MQSRFLRPLAVTLAVMTLPLSACTHVMLDTTRPIEKTGDSFFGAHYQQGGQSLNLDDMTAKLQNHPASAPELDGFMPIHVAGMITGGAGGFCLGWGLGTSISGNSVSPALWIAGGSLVLVAGALNYVAQQKVSRAVDRYNASFKNPRAELYRIEPYFAWLPAAQVVRTTPSGLVGGLTLSF